MLKLRKVALVTTLIACNGVAADQTLLVISVKQRTQQQQIPLPFTKVGAFEIFRGESKFASANCPDPSNKDGKTSCTITCEPKETIAKPLRVIPPGRALRVRGFVAPPAEDVELTGCKLTPSDEREFIYVESSLALAEFLKTEKAFVQIAKQSGNDWELADASLAVGVFKAVGATQAGKRKLAQFQEITGALAESRQMRQDSRGSELAKQHSFGVSNVLLGEIVKTNLDSETASKIKLTGEKTDYYRNLQMIEVTLESKQARTSQQNLLLNDIQTLKAKPFTLRGPETIKGYAIKN